MNALSCLLARGDHAARCPRCRAAAGRDAALRALVDAAPPPALSARARDGAFARALATPVVIAQPRPRRVFLTAGLALAAAAAMAIVVASPDDGGPDPGGTTARALAARETTAVGHGKVTLTADGVAWQTGPTEVYLLTGQVDVEVDPAPHRSFRVRTPDFVVDVLGTVFDVSADGVTVTRGAVRISSTSGAVLVERLGAGGHWRPDPETSAGGVDHDGTAAAAAPAGTPALSADEPEELAMDPVSAGSAGRRRRDSIDPTAPPSQPAPTVLDARGVLSRGDPAGARAMVAAVLAARPSHAVRVDAELLLAESYISTDVATAVRRYVAVADRYREVGVGDVALYAAARLQAKAGRANEARALFAAYLERYPDGYNARDARARVESR